MVVEVVVAVVVVAVVVVVCMGFVGGMVPEKGALVACLRFGGLGEERELAVQE